MAKSIEPLSTQEFIERYLLPLKMLVDAERIEDVIALIQAELEDLEVEGEGEEEGTLLIRMTTARRALQRVLEAVETLQREMEEA